MYKKAFIKFTVVLTDMNNVPLCQNEPPDIFIVIITHGLTIIDHY
jgi:hypothetical protein